MFGGLRARMGRMGTLLAVVPVIPALVWATMRSADDPNLRLEVDLSARKLSVIQDNNVVKTYSVAVGRPSNPTPTGQFRTGRITWNPSWIPPKSWWARNRKPAAPDAPENPMQGVKIYFRAPAYYIHGTNVPSSMGRAASRGCIRMTEEESKALARTIEKAGGSVQLLIRS